MKNLYCLILLCAISTTNLYSQKHSLFVELGSKTGNTYLKNKDKIDCLDAPCPTLLERKQFASPFTLGSLSIGYAHQISSYFEISAAINANLKGFNESFKTDNSGRIITQTLLRSEGYIGLLLGGQYQFFQKPFGHLFVQAHINPEMGNIQKWDNTSFQYTASYALFWSGRLGFGSQIKLNSKLSFLLNSFYETALTKYEMSSFTPIFKPFSFGANIGMKYYF
jgi:hypothetical protein